MSTVSAHPFYAISSLSVTPERRSDAEKRWVSFQPYLWSKGYKLRPRYQPDWVPSWKTTGADPDDCEDSLNSLPVHILDATRVRDQLQVVIKMLAPSEVDREGEEELAILQHFSSPPHSDNPSNHVVPCLDSFPLPGVKGGMFVVMPLLSRYSNPPFSDLSEISDFLTQVFEGLEYLHANDVAHCDIAPENIMMNRRPLYDEPFHPFYQHLSLDGRRPISPKYLRSQRPTRYYFIDFGYSKWFQDATSPRLLVGTRAREATPEQVSGSPYDPFKGDIYQLGAMLRRDLIPNHEPLLNFLLPLARDMTNSNPNQRPTIQSARHAMSTQFFGLPGWRKRWPLIPSSTPFGRRCVMVVAAVAAEVIVLLKKLVWLLLLRG